MRIIELPQVADRMTFLYLERCTIHRDSNAVTATDDRGTIHVPASALGCLLLGPGTRVTHQAMVLLGDSGASVVWVGAGAVRMYAAGRSLARSNRYLQQQVRAWADHDRRLAVCRAMYAMRFPDDACEGLTLAQLRGKEGARIRKIYRRESERTGVLWKGRRYEVEDWAAGDPVNRALSSGSAALYGIVHAVINALGMSAGLGFVHEGNALSFVHDVADLYKAETTIPIAFQIAAEGALDIDSEARRRLRARCFDVKLLARVVTDLRALLEVDLGSPDPLDLTREVLLLWDDLAGAVEGGANWGEDW